MSRKPRKSNRKKRELKNEKPTRSSARLSNRQSDCSHVCLQTTERKRARFQRNINTSCPAVITRSRGRILDRDAYSSNPDESSMGIADSTDNNSDSDRSCVKTLIFSSSDNTAHVGREYILCNKPKVLSNGYNQRILDKKRVNGGQCSEEERVETSNGEVLRSLTNQNSKYNLRSRSHRVAESGNETSSVLEEKIAVAHNLHKKTKLKVKQKENKGKNSGLDKDRSQLEEVSKPSSFSWNQDGDIKKSLKKYVKKTVEKDVKKSFGRDVQKEKRTGTLAHKRELRDILDEQDDGYEDDAFEGTPFRNRKPLLKYKLSPVIIDTSIQSISTDTEYRTPLSRTPVNRLRPVGPLSSGTSEGQNAIANNVQKKTKLKVKQNESNRKHSGVDKDSSQLEAINQFAKPSSLSSNQGEDVKKSVEKDVKKLGEKDVKESIPGDVKKEKRTGTLARKRELRDMLEQQDNGYEDDAFEGTPFRNRKPLLKYKLSPVILDTSIQSISTDTEYRTPFSRTPVNRLRPAGPLSSGTSESDIMTPGLLNSVNRNNIDRYVNQLRRRKFRLGCKKKVKSHTPLSKQRSRIIETKSFDFDTNSSVQKFTTTENENCEDDYYWSDIE